MSLVLILAACGGGNQPGALQPVEGFYGGIAADEPRAAVVGRDVLVAGGSAADAAIAASFMLAVTLPSSAGLGGGGACVALDGGAATATLFDFTAAPAGQGRVAVPALTRGMAILHARHGRTPWGQLLVPAENTARFGTPVSRALARDLAEAPTDLTRDPASARIFAPAGRLIAEGESLVQLDLSGTLAQIRQKGAGEAYGGILARAIAEAAPDDLPLDVLRGYLPQAATPPAIVINSQRQIAIAGDRPATAAFVARLLGVGLSGAPGDADRPRFWAEAGAAVDGALAETLSRGPAPILPASGEVPALTARAKSGSHERPARNLGPVDAARAGATSLVVVDKNGLAVTCAFGMNAAWGTGRVLPGTGILTAPAPAPESPRAATALVYAPGNGVFYLATGASGRAAPSALAQVTLAGDGNPDIAAVVARPRIAYDGVADVARIEPGVPQDSLARGGLKATETAPLGLVNAFACPDELIRGRPTCRSAIDPRGAGLAYGSGANTGGGGIFGSGLFGGGGVPSSGNSVLGTGSGPGNRPGR